MKKSILSLLAVVAMVCSFASCNKTAQKSETNDELSAMSDSVAMIQGYMTGQQLAQQFMMMAMQGMPVDSMEFLKGFKKGITDTTKFSYYAGQIQGVQTAMSLVKEGIDVKLFTEYLEAALKGDTTKLGMDQEAAYTYVQNYYQKKQEIENKEKFGKNIDAGKKAIAEFSKQEGVITTKSGIAYRYASKGTGKSPVDGDKVKVTYRGTLIDGTEFDKSEEPVELSINQVIPGWTELLKLMKVGDQITAYIPYDLAYGANGSGSSIEPFSTLIFDIKLLEVAPAEKK
ncbi:FKBP-type peptidyl-prolyl cis-trans isomerase [Porphyromonas uenonis]|uniref:FKBP-type peptidyl-prolyl cis-trans isomerase n=1 Tax=Porphyromonas uenonis TaxID=281920 RepID=UPI0026EBE554|nr:FKBP-type peptidyl-prolyl cis-trans isomerase [Porphyromonas uenonis]